MICYPGADRGDGAEGVGAATGAEDLGMRGAWTTAGEVH